MGGALGVGFCNYNLTSRKYYRKVARSDGMRPHARQEVLGAFPTPCMCAGRISGKRCWKGRKPHHSAHIRTRGTLYGLWQDIGGISGENGRSPERFARARERKSCRMSIGGELVHGCARWMPAPGTKLQLALVKSVVQIFTQHYFRFQSSNSAALFR